MWEWFQAHWLPLALGVVLWNLEAIRRHLAEISHRLELAHPTEKEARFRHEVEQDKLERQEQAWEG